MDEGLKPGFFPLLSVCLLLQCLHPGLGGIADLLTRQFWFMWWGRHSRCSQTAQSCWLPRQRETYKCPEHFRPKPELLAPYPKLGFLCHFRSLACGVQLTDTEYSVGTAAGRSRNTTSQFPSGDLGCPRWRRLPLRDSPSSGLASKTRTCMGWRVGGSGFCVLFLIFY